MQQINWDLTPQNVEPCILIMYQIKETAIKIKTDLFSKWQLYYLIYYPPYVLP